MEFSYTDEQRLIGETAFAFFAENATSERTRAAMAGAGVDAALWVSFCRELGLSGIALAEEAGGAGMGLVELAIVAEAAGAQVAALPMLGSLALSAQAIAAGGSEAQRAAWLPGLVSGESIAAWVEDEDLRVDADGRLSGGSRFVAHAAAAGLLVVTDGRGAWLVRADAPGVRITAQTSMDQTRPLGDVRLDGAVGEPLADPAAALAAARRAGLVVLAAEALGGAQACLDRTVAYAKERIQFGRPIGSFQALQHRAAEMFGELQLTRSAVEAALAACDEDAADLPALASLAKAVASDTAQLLANQMIQLHGGIGMTHEHDAGLYLKRALVLGQSYGSAAFHRERWGGLNGY